ncbi:MAG: VOC family protein, partial [Thermoplasmata archaeon]|nr:VOC family protein [Thermoplasmata archaeon]
NSGQFRSSSGPYVFIAEIPADQKPQMQLAFGVTSTEGFDPGPAVEVVAPFEDTHWGTRLMKVRDPDGRLWSVEGPGSR